MQQINVLLHHEVRLLAIVQFAVLSKQLLKSKVVTFGRQRVLWELRRRSRSIRLWLSEECNSSLTWQMKFFSRVAGLGVGACHTIGDAFLTLRMRLVTLQSSQ